MAALRRWILALQVLAALRVVVPLLLKYLFSAWARHTMEVYRATEKEELIRFRTPLGKKARSIWLMDKGGLINLAINELGID